MTSTANASTLALPKSSGSNWTPLGALRAVIDMTAEQLTLGPDLKYVKPGVLKLVALAMLRHARSSTGGRIWPSVATIARCACVSPRTAQYALRALEWLGIIRKTLKETRYKGATYSMIAGRQKPKATTQAEAEQLEPTPDEQAHASKATKVRDAYRAALETRHGTPFHRPVRAETWGSYTEEIDWLATQRGEAFEVAAGHVMAAYMREQGRKDGALVEQLHRPDWLAHYLPAIVVELRRKRAPQTEEPSEQEPDGGLMTFEEFEAKKGGTP